MTSQRDQPAESNRLWRVGSREILIDHPIVVGILNVTPDSFSDGGNFFDIGAATEHVTRMIEEGADIIDVGGESTRPGASVVDAAEEIGRVVPVIAAIRHRWPEMPVSIDTTKAAVAGEALDAGADIINDVSALRLDPSMASLAGSRKCGVILMHSRGDVESMASYDNAIYSDVTSEVLSELGSQILLAEEAGVDRSAIVLDPGFGFSKTTGNSMTLLEGLGLFQSYDVPVMVGFSRKRLLRNDATVEMSVEEKDNATARFNLLALHGGAMLFRVHNIAVSRRAIDHEWAHLSAEA